MAGWSDLTPEGARYFAQLDELASYVIKVGFPEGSGGYEDGTTVAEVAAYNDLGTSTIPARPFMEQAFNNHGDVMKGLCEQAQAILSSGGAAQAALDTVGSGCKALIQAEIVSGGFVPNAPSTIRQKGSSTPLIDTGTMRGSVSYVIESE